MSMKEREAVAAIGTQRSSVATSSRPSAAVRVSILKPHMLASNRGTIGQGFLEGGASDRPAHGYGSQPSFHVHHALARDTSSEAVGLAVELGACSLVVGAGLCEAFARVGLLAESVADGVDAAPVPGFWSWAAARGRPRSRAARSFCTDRGGLPALLPSPSQGTPTVAAESTRCVSLLSLGDTAAPPGEGATTTAGDVHRVDLWRALGQHNEQRRRGREGSNRSCLSIPGHVSLNDGQDKW